MKYLTKPEVQLCHHKASKEETNVTSTEDKNWGVDENDVRDIYWIILRIVCGSEVHSSLNWLVYSFHDHEVWV